MVRHRRGGRHGGGNSGGGNPAPAGPGGAERIFADAAYWDARVLQTAVVLDVFTLLADGPATAEDVAVRCATEKRATELLLNALVEIDYLIKRNDRFTNAPHAQAYLVRGAKGYVGWTLLVEAQAWNVWGNLEQTIRSGKPAPGPMLYKDAEDRTKTLLRSLHARAEALFTRHVAERVKLEGATTLLDLGGGAGSYTIAFARRNPKLNATIFDLPLAIEIAKDTVGKTDVHKRVQFAEGNYRTDAIGGPFDVIYLSNVLHTESEENVKIILKKVFDALEPGGHLVLRDMFMSPDRAGPHGAVFSLNMLLNTDGGRCYSGAEVEKFLKEAGFERAVPIEAGVLVDARKAGPPRLAIDQPRQNPPKQEKKPGEQKPGGGGRGPRPPQEKRAPKQDGPGPVAASPETKAAMAEEVAPAAAPAEEPTQEAKAEETSTSGEGSGDGGT